MKKCLAIYEANGKKWRCMLPQDHEGGHSAQQPAGITEAEDAPAAVVKSKERRNPEMLERRQGGYSVPRFLNRRRNRGRRGSDLVS